MLVQQNLSPESFATVRALEWTQVGLNFNRTHFDSEMDHQVARALEGLVAVHEGADEVELHLPGLVRLQHLHTSQLVLFPLLP